MTGAATTICETLASPPMALTLVWENDTIVEIKMAWAREGEVSAPVTDMGREMEKALARYVAGEEPGWPALPLDLGRVGEFQREVLARLATCPRGTVWTYGELAAKAGRPGAARAVGRAMATNPFPIVIPCHRIVGAKGKLTGFGGGLDMKRYLLTLEGALDGDLSAK